jgi:hypothetical protein
MPENNNIHTTLDEIRFIKKLGSCRHTDKPQDRKKLLKAYLAQCKNRVEWGGVDSEQVIRFAKHELAELL